jgi:hypothetical protein
MDETLSVVRQLPEVSIMTPTSLNRLAEWDAAAVALADRAEELAHATSTFADTTYVDALKSRRNQLVIGRRGTGKTHLLRRVAEDYLTDFDRLRVVPILIDGSALRQEALRPSDDPQFIALSIYVEFVKALAAQLYELVTARLPTGFWDRFFPSQSARAAAEATELATTLHTLLTTGEVRFIPAGAGTMEAKTLHEAATSVTAGIRASISDPRSLGWSVDLGASHDRTTTDSAMTLRTVQGQVILPFSQVTKTIERLLSLLGKAKLSILFDEWSDVDHDIHVQPYLASLIKRTLSPSMYLKLACIPIRTQLATYVTPQSPIPIGLQRGADIHGEIDLDAQVFIGNDVSQFLPFMALVLKKHMGAVLDWVAQMDMIEFDRFLWSDVFVDQETYSECCQASAGVPRDFINVFRSATAHKLRRAGTSIAKPDIRQAAIMLRNEKRANLPKSSPEIMLLNRIYRTVSEKQKTYLFLVREEYSDYPAMELLWVERLIHRTPIVYRDKSTSQRYFYYLIDYGECVDLADETALQEGAAITAVIRNSIGQFVPPKWLEEEGQAALEDLPGIIAFITRFRQVLEEPAGRLTPAPEDIIVPDSVFVDMVHPSGLPNRSTQ